jgi:NAD(P)-dependent dehydrogenase (short-subunit alcohol dehydrogenase family)
VLSPAPLGALELIDDELMHRQLDTNVVGPLRTIRAVMPAWRARGHGVVVNVSSVVGIATSPFGGAYAATKHALEAMSETLHWEAAPAGIRVHLIEPSRFPTTGFGANIVRPSGWEGSHFEAKRSAASTPMAHKIRKTWPMQSREPHSTRPHRCAHWSEPTPR